MPIEVSWNPGDEPAIVEDWLLPSQLLLVLARAWPSEDYLARVLWLPEPAPRYRPD
jgi:hypothetical protein